jgi:ADP-ribose pyrophosphatase
MTRDDVEVVEKTTPFQGYFRIDRYKFRHRLFRGGWSDVFSREVFERGHAVALLPYDPRRDEVILVEQFRAGAYAANRGPWLMEVVAGIIDEGERPEDVARREAREEAGLEVREIELVSDYIASPGGMSHWVKVYVGHVDAAGAGGVFGLPNEHEDIRVDVMPFAKAMEHMKTGRICDAASIIPLQWLALNRDTLRQRWRG